MRNFINAASVGLLEQHSFRSVELKKAGLGLCQGRLGAQCA